ncbi:MAG: 4Fe-4S dicluster domain-containing protein [Candidatus Helarchaeota archaeon]
MVEKILNKKDFPKLFNEMLNENQVYAPVNNDNIISFKKISSIDQIYTEYFNSKIPPKNILFPQKEVLFKFKKLDNKIELINIPPVNEKTIILFIRPCDARSIKLLEIIFASGKFKDNIFMERKKNTLMIGLACNSPRSTCFCSSVGLSPFYDKDVDIFFVDLNDRYYIRGVSEKGIKFLDSISWLENANANDIKEVKMLSEKSKGLIKTELDLNEIDKTLDNIYDNQIWDELSISCLGCGTCSFLCPTCSCFDVVDEQITKNTGQRVRIWDTCQFCLFSLHGSGHNPRPGKKERIRQRIFHKFNYYIKNYNLFGCVGCGRCIINCPDNSDLREDLKKIKEIAEEVLLST